MHMGTAAHRALIIFQSARVDNCQSLSGSARFSIACTELSNCSADDVGLSTPHSIFFLSFNFFEK